MALLTFFDHSDVRVSYFSQHVHKLLLNGIHFRTGLVKRSGRVWQTGLLEALSQALAQKLRYAWRVQTCFQFLRQEYACHSLLDFTSLR